MLTVLVLVIILVAIFIILTAVIVGAESDKEFMTSWEECNGNCNSCKDQGQCMNRPYN